MAYQKLNNCSRMLSITQSNTENIPNPARPKTSISVTGATIVVSGGAVKSVTLATNGAGYTALGSLGFSITGSLGTSATLAPYIAPDSSIGITVTAGGSGYTDGTYISGSTYTLATTGSGTTSNNAIPTQPCQLYINCTTGGIMKITTAGGDDINVGISAGSYIFPVHVIRVWLTVTGTAADATYFGVW
jgi:hypothetical protein